MRLSRIVAVVGLFAAFPFGFSEAQEWGFFRESSEMRQKIDALPSASAQNISVPVLLGVETSQLTKNFADPRGGGTRSHEGLDILAPEGTPVASPTDAVVTRTGSGTNSGLYVRTANPGGETFVYMHLSSVATGIEAGDLVKRGEIIGFVGNTGNASGGPAHLHFEIRANRTATDPYPRLTEVFTLTERMQGITQALERGGSAHVAMYASRFRAIFEAAAAQGLIVPQPIASLLGAGVAVTPSAPPVNSELAFGETNDKIIELQKFLIASASGEASARLARTGATGYFGSLTQAALIEYQRASELKPTGVIDDATYLLVFALGREDDSSETEPEQEMAATSTASFSFTRDLEFGMKGEDVRALQVFLNSNGFPVAQSGDGSKGLETNYFGPATRAAVSALQKAHNIAPTAGYFGPKTRAVVAAM